VKHDSITEFISTLTVSGVPGMCIAPTPASPSSPPVPHDIDLLKKSVCLNPIVCPIS